MRSKTAFTLSLAVHLTLGAAAIYGVKKGFDSAAELQSDTRVKLCIAQFVPPPKPEPPKPEPIKPKPVEKKIEQPKPKPIPKPKKKKVPLKKAPPEPEPPKPEPEPEPPQPPPSVPKQTTAPKVSDAPVVPIQAPSSEERYMDEHLARIAQLLQENLYYPRIARKRGITGEVLVAFTLDAQGQVGSVEVMRGSQSILNKAAVRTIENLSGRFPRPETRLSLQVPIAFRLQ